MEIKSGIYTSEEQIKKVLSETFIDYLGEDLRSLIEERLLKSTIIKIKTFESFKTNTFKYRLERAKLCRKIFKLKKSYNYFDDNNERKIIEKCISCRGLNCHFAIYDVAPNFNNFNIKTHSIVFMNKQSKQDFDGLIVHELAHAICSNIKLKKQENLIFLEDCCGFQKRTLDYTWDEKNKVYQKGEFSMPEGALFNEYLTDKVASEIVAILHNKNISFTKIKQDKNYSGCYFAMDKIGNELFEKCGKQLFRYAITGDEKELKKIMSYKNLKYIMEGFDNYYNNNWKIIFPTFKDDEQLEEFEKEFDKSTTKFKSFIRTLIKEKDKEI